MTPSHPVIGCGHRLLRYNMLPCRYYYITYFDNTSVRSNEKNTHYIISISRRSGWYRSPQKQYCNYTAFMCNVMQPRDVKLRARTQSYNKPAAAAMVYNDIRPIFWTAIQNILYAAVLSKRVWPCVTIISLLSTVVTLWKHMSIIAL